MPLSPKHKLKTRAKIIEASRILFNRHGFEGVTIEMIMGTAGLTRGGFYNHFKNKEALYSEAVSSFLMGRGLKWRTDAGIDPKHLNPEAAKRMLQSYLSAAHLADIDSQCPMIALPSDVARSSPEVQSAYQDLLEGMVWLFETSMEQQSAQTGNQTGNQKRDQASNQINNQARQSALTLSALCVGGMVLARTLPNSPLAEEIRAAAQRSATEISESFTK